MKTIIRQIDIDYWTTVIDQRSENKYKADIYFRKALSVVTDWIKETVDLEIKPKGLIERALYKVISNSQDPFNEVFAERWYK